ncbi:amidohydrolase [soil metagenome]|jgi:predicted amidohydrolase YtcJ
MAGRISGAFAGDEPFLLVGGTVLTLDDSAPRARAVLIKRRRIAWVGDDPAQVAAEHCRVIDVTGATVMPAFVNAHTHLTRLGLLLSALDLGVAGSVEDCLAALRATVGVTPEPIIWGVGWDETRWPERRPPTADELTQATSGRPVMLSRSDGHCVVVDRTSVAALPLARARGVDRGSDGRPTGLLRQEAAQVAQSWFSAQLAGPTIENARRLAARELAAAGVASAHEMGGPHRMGPADFDAWIEGEWPIEVIGYWGDMDLEFVESRGLRRVGGSLLLDGTIGSHSAALATSYADRAGSGQLYLDTTELREFAIQATRKGIQIALHATGDRAVEQAIKVFEGMATVVGPEQVLRSRPRLEYAALMEEDAVHRLASLGVVVTAQPTNEQQLGMSGGAYDQRLGADRARTANPLGALSRAGVRLAFGCDDGGSLLPWSAIEAATHDHHEAGSMDRMAALKAATIGGRAAARQPTVGAIRTGHRADLAVFEGGPEAPGRCVMTTVAGTIVHGANLLVRA